MNKKIIKLTFIIINYNTCELTIRCISKILEALKNISYEIIVVDNCSNDSSIEQLRKNKQILLIENSQNRGFSSACNQAINLAQESEYYYFVNSDTIPNSDAIYGMLNYMETNNDVAAIGPKLINQDNSMQNSFANFPSFLTEIFGINILSLFNSKKYISKKTYIESEIEVDSLIGAFIIIRGCDLKKIHGFDERYFFFLEETDLFRRLKNIGKKIIYSPNYTIPHIQGASANKNPSWSRHNFLRSKYQYLLKWDGVFKFLIIYIRNMLWYHFKTFSYFIFNILCFFKSKKLSIKLEVAFHLTKNHYLGFPPYSKYNLSTKVYKDFMIYYLDQLDFIINDNILNKELSNIQFSCEDKSVKILEKINNIFNSKDITIFYYENNKTNPKKIFDAYFKAYNALLPINELIAVITVKNDKNTNLNFLALKTKRKYLALSDFLSETLKKPLNDDDFKLNVINTILQIIRNLHIKNIYYDNLSLDDFLISNDTFPSLNNILITNLNKLRYGFFSTMLNKNKNLQYLFNILNKISTNPDNDRNILLKKYNNSEIDINNTQNN